MEILDIAPFGYGGPGEGWMDDGACSADVSVVELIQFISPSDQAEAHEAIVVCGTCPVIELCGRYGLERGEVGVWGGRWLRPVQEARA